jgi:hypothetical protein
VGAIVLWRVGEIVREIVLYALRRNRALRSLRP